VEKLAVTVIGVGYVVSQFRQNSRQIETKSVEILAELSKHVSRSQL